MPSLPAVPVVYVNGTSYGISESVPAFPATPRVSPFVVVQSAPQDYFDILDEPHRAEQHDSAPLASSVPVAVASDQNVRADSWPPPDKLSDTDPLGKTTSTTTSRGSNIAGGSEWTSFLNIAQGRWMGYTVGPLRGYLGDTNSDHDTLIAAADPPIKSFDEQLEDERIRTEEDAERRHRYEERVRREQRRELRKEDKLRRRPKLLAERLAAQASHQVACRLHVKIMWNHYRSRLNGKVRHSLAASHTCC